MKEKYFDEEQEYDKLGKQKSKLINEYLNNKLKNAKEILADPVKFEELLDSFKGKAKNLPQVGNVEISKVVEEALDFALMVRLYISKEYTEVPKDTIIAFIAVIAYVVVPVDVIPDFIPGVGQIDDAIVLAFFINQVHKDIVKFNVWKENSRFVTVK